MYTLLIITLPNEFLHQCYVSLRLEKAGLPLEDPAVVGIAPPQPDDLGVQAGCSFLVSVVYLQSFTGQLEQRHVLLCSTNGVLVVLTSLHVVLCALIT